MLFELDNARIGYNGVLVFNGITLSIRRGEKVALVGPSGAGKSTLLSTLFDQRRIGTAWVPQEYALVKNLSVFHNVFMGRLNRHSSLYNLLNLIHPLDTQRSAVEPLLDELGLRKNMDTPVGELSGGQQQRTAVARALFQGGDVVLADEPVSSVDPVQSRLVLDSLHHHFDTVVLAMHDVPLALDFADRLIGIRDGQALFDQPTDGLTPTDLDDFFLPT